MQRGLLIAKRLAARPEPNGENDRMRAGPPMIGGFTTVANGAVGARFRCADAQNSRPLQTRTNKAKRACVNCGKCRGCSELGQVLTIKST